MVESGDLDALTEDEWDKVRPKSANANAATMLTPLKCWSVNVKANMHLLRKASPIFNDDPEGGVFLLTTSIAGVAPQGSNMAYSVSKAAGKG